MGIQELLYIYKYGEEVLKQKGLPVKNIDQTIIDLIEKMKFTMHGTPNAVGLAAPQVGESLMLSVIDISMGQDEKEFTVLLNPFIAEAEGEETDSEGCLSFPNISLDINRSTTVLLKGIDINGKEYEKEYTGFMARAIQHEIDHLNGILIADHVSPLKRQLLKKEVKKLKKNGEWE
jgi:peptide deformylase